MRKSIKLVRSRFGPMFMRKTLKKNQRKTPRNNPSGTPFSSVSMSEIKARAIEAGSHFFDRDSMRFFNSKLHGDGREDKNGNVYFVTSEKPDPRSPRRYTVRVQDAAGHIHSASPFMAYASLKDANAAKWDFAAKGVYEENPTRFSVKNKSTNVVHYLVRTKKTGQVVQRFVDLESAKKYARWWASVINSPVEIEKEKY